MKQNKRVSNSASNNNKDPNDRDDPYRGRNTSNLLPNLPSRSRETAAHSGLSSTPEGSLNDDALRTLLADDNQLQTNKSRPAVVAFPKRLGVEDYTAQAPEGSSILLDRGVQTASKYCKSFNDVSVHYSRDLHVSSAYDQPQGRPVLPRANNGGPLTENGPPRSSIPIQNWRPMPTTSTGVSLPVAKVDEDPQNSEAFYRPSPKRGAIRSPPDATRVHRRKLTDKPTSPSISNRLIPPSMPYKPVPLSLSYKPVPPASFKPKNAPAILPTPNTAHSSMPALPHIKWQGNNEPSEPTGDKCLICRRDLIFSPEGPVERPPISPPVAVLHCGHTFHDYCLQKITPEDQSKSPPCIPCAVGEN